MGRERPADINGVVPALLRRRVIVESIDARMNGCVSMIRPAMLMKMLLMSVRQRFETEMPWRNRRPRRGCRGSCDAAGARAVCDAS